MNYVPIREGCDCGKDHANEALSIGANVRATILGIQQDHPGAFPLVRIHVHFPMLFSLLVHPCPEVC